MDFVGLHIEAGQSGKGVLNEGPLISIGTVTAVVFHVVQVLGAPSPIIEYQQQFVDNQKGGKEEGRLVSVCPTGTGAADQLGGVTFLGSVVIHNLPEEGRPASLLLAAGSAVSVVGTRLLRTSSAAIEIDSGFAGEVASRRRSAVVATARLHAV